MLRRTFLKAAAAVLPATTLPALHAKQTPVTPTQVGESDDYDPHLPFKNRRMVVAMPKADFDLLNEYANDANSHTV